MRAFHISLVLIAVLAACSSERAPEVARGFAQEEGAEAVTRMAASGRTASEPGIATLPDRGVLNAYPRSGSKRGAYTWHPVELSEAHALGAVVSGELVVTAPDGRPIRLRHMHHTEHADGNWTWVGREPGGQPGTEAIITFGSDAVFGSIPDGSNPPLRITSARGHTWIVETDPAASAEIAARMASRKGPDYLIPPRNWQAMRAAKGTALASAGMTATATPALTAETTVDVLLGYTNGLATALGSTPAAVTRMTYLVDVTNQAYANSKIPARLRLVRAQKVDYTDVGSNEDALYDLTGVECTPQGGGQSCTFVGPAPSLESLHLAREEYGADLVALVRDFRDPEHEGCGIAWLIGAGQVAITTEDVHSGFSVVSDGADGSFFCHDEALAHELGHNMGSAHDRETAAGGDGLQAGEYGRYPYSFGYKTNAFFTVMAYGDENQQRYRVFSNPRVTYCGGMACGTTSDDNARSLSNTMPVIASFHAPLERQGLRQLDANDDGKSDLFFMIRADQRFALWYMDGTQRIGSASAAIGRQYRWLDAGDLNRDNDTDLVFVDDMSRTFRMALRSSGGYSVRTMTKRFKSTSVPLGMGDVDGDGRADILFRGGSPGVLAVWFMGGGTSVRSTGSYAVPSGYRFVGTGDFNRDGRADVAWTRSDGRVAISTRTATSFSNKILSYTYSSSSVLEGVQDIDGDGRSDLVFSADDGARTVVWLMSGTTRLGSLSSARKVGFEAFGAGDFDGNGLGDVLLFSPSTRRIEFQLSSGDALTRTAVSYVPGSGSVLMDQP